MSNITYFNGNYMPMEDVHISPTDRGFVFADGLYEVIRNYPGQLFHIDDHLQRLSYGAYALRYNRSEFPELKEVSQQLLERNDLTNKHATIYIQVTRGNAPRGHAFPPEDTPLTVFASTKEFIGNPAQMENGIKTVLVSDTRWGRCDIKTVGLLANSMAYQYALEHGAGEGILVRDGVLLEGTRSNLFAVRNKTVITAPKSNNILGGISRQIVLDLCKEHEISHTERPIFQWEMDLMDEFFITGTTTEITPVVQIDGQMINSGEPGKMTQHLQSLFNALKK